MGFFRHYKLPTALEVKSVIEQTLAETPKEKVQALMLRIKQI